MSWKISNQDLSQPSLATNESIFSLGNGYLGVRGNFEEGYEKEVPTIRGTYINAFHDITEIAYGERLYGFPETQQKLLNIIDAQGLEFYFGEDEERFSMFDGTISFYERSIHLDKGYVERKVHWRSPKGKEIKLTFRRLVSFVTKELFLIDVDVEAVNFDGMVKVKSTINGDVSNYVASDDPRISNGHGKLLSVKRVGHEGEKLFLLNETTASQLEVACVSTHTMDQAPLTSQIANTVHQVEATFTFSLSKSSLHFTKWNVFTDTQRHKENLIDTGLEILGSTSSWGFEHWFKTQEVYLKDFWEDASIVIKGDDRLQEGLRFNLYQLLQSVGRDEYSNISAKGLSGEGYDGHYFWDTEIYMFPVFLMLKPELAKNLLLYRYSKLDDARNRAKEMGHKKGALYPWRTISGTECSGYFPSGSAQYHISADIAYSYINYYLATADEEFMERYGFEILVETARIWLEVGHFCNGSFKIDEVTGPDEYTCLVNNNYYTNVMAKYNLSWAVKMYEHLKTSDSKLLDGLCKRLRIDEDEILQMRLAEENMYLPYDEKRKINPQDDTFLNKAIWDFENTPKDHYPLLLHYHPLTLYRYQVCKQADTVLAHFLLEDEAEPETIKHSFDYYEKVTTHDSSLSSCIFSMMAARIGYYEKAYDYFMETARMDLDNTHGNTKDGLHMANMGGTWMATVYGFAGFRLKEDGISFHPFIPKQWDAYSFQIQYRDCKLIVKITKSNVYMTLLSGGELKIKLYDSPVILKEKQTYETLLIKED